MPNRQVERLRESRTMTIAQAAARGDTLRLVCLDCGHKREILARQLVARHGPRIIADLKPKCVACAQKGRRGVGLHKPGYGTYLELIAPGD